jgi:hypothetical protein
MALLPALFVLLVLLIAAAKKSHGISSASIRYITNLNQSKFSFGYLWVKLNSTEGAAARGKIDFIVMISTHTSLNKDFCEKKRKKTHIFLKKTAVKSLQYKE